MERRIYFLAGDVLSNTVTGAAAAIVDPSWSMPAGMFVGMLTAMLSGMVFGMAGAMQAPAVEMLFFWGGSIGILVVLLTYVVAAILHSKAS